MTNSKNRAELKAELKAKTDKLVSQDKELFANLSKEEITERKKERAKKFREENESLLSKSKLLGIENLIKEIKDFAENDIKKFNGAEYQQQVDLEEILMKLGKDKDYSANNAIYEIIRGTNDVIERIDCISAVFSAEKKFGTTIMYKKLPFKGSDMCFVYETMLDAYNYGYAETNHWYPGMSPTERKDGITFKDYESESIKPPFSQPVGYHREADFNQGQYWALVSDDMTDDRKNDIMAVVCYGHNITDIGIKEESSPLTWGLS